ncbi:hypothetical protein ADUPG1_007576, partial [Aduncisulcus paluster]
MGPAWKTENAYAVLEPTYDDWIEEELVFDTRTNQILYKLGGKEYRVNGMPITRPSIRVFMHAYGWHTGHYMKLDCPSCIICDGLVSYFGGGIMLEIFDKSSQQVPIKAWVGKKDDLEHG